MNNYELYVNVFTTAFELEDKAMSETLEYQGIDAWDSVGHGQFIGV